MLMVYLSTALFLGWLWAASYRIWRHYLVARGAGKGNSSLAGSPEGMKRMAVLLKNEDQQTEWIVRRKVAAAIRQAPQMTVVLVDGNSTDQTPLILERLARQLDLGFCRLSSLDKQCARTQKTGFYRNPGVPAELHDCPGPCFAAAGLAGGGTDNSGSSRGARCVVYTTFTNA
ncbi:MAG: hypothetical protein FWC60_03340 [Firmicutes bacterium]|nr:hypothetical protein [Bacillota bacterium]